MKPYTCTILEIRNNELAYELTLNNLPSIGTIEPMNYAHKEAKKGKPILKKQDCSTNKLRNKPSKITPIPP